MSEAHARDLRRHDAQIESLEKEVHALRADIGEIKKIVEQTRGAWAVLSWLAALSAAIGAIAAKLFAAFFGK
ncbi:MAG: hypothetical protein ACO3C4_01765 [Candidatus Limnocylindrus sp.]